MTMKAKSELSLGALVGDFRVLALLFIGFRLLLLFTYMPIFGAGWERGVTASGDFFTYFQLSAFVGGGLLPFRDWWSEFPPIPHTLTTLVFLLSRENYTSFAMLMALILIGFDTGNLALMRAIGTRLHGAGTGMALAWVYALSFAPLVFIFWNFESIAAFFFLLSVYALIRERDGRSSVWAGIGALVKYTPALTLGAVWRFRPPRAALRYTVTLFAILLVVYGALYAVNPANTLASLNAQFGKASYQTVWALIDGNYRTGNFGTPFERLDPANAYTLEGNPPVVPSILRLGIAALIGLFVYLRTRRDDVRGIVAFVAITLLIFFLQSQGWSPQWLAQIIPFMLLCFPSRYGVYAIFILTMLTFLEYPFLWIRTGDTGGEMSGALLTPFAALVIARTVVLIAVCIALYRLLRQEPIRIEA
jgi:hypothetical protein